MKLSVTAAVLGLAVTLHAVPGLAHHGWRWTTGGNIELTGVVESAKLGNPHGVVRMDAEGEKWTVEVGQPWRNERAGLKPAHFTPGNELTIIGEPSADSANKRMKAERILINGHTFDLYPNRD